MLCLLYFKSVHLSTMIKNMPNNDKLQLKIKYTFVETKAITYYVALAFLVLTI